jgi:hypothetical protein
MAIDPNISLGVRPIELANPLAQYGQVAQIQNYQNQNIAAQNQNALAQYQLGAAQRAETKDIARTNALSQAGTDDTAIANALLRLGDLKGYSDFLKSNREMKSAAALQKKHEVETEASQFKLTKDKLNHGYDSLGSSSTPQEAIRKLNEGVTKGYFDMKTATAEAQQLQNMTPEQFRQYRIEKVAGLLDAKDKLKNMLPDIRSQDTGSAITPIQNNPMLPGYGQPVQGMAPLAKTKTFADINAEKQTGIAGARLALEREKFNFEQRNPGYELKEDADGNFFGVNKRTLQSFPVMIGGGAAPTAAPMVPSAGGMPGPRMAQPGAVVPAIPGMTSVLDQNMPAVAPAAGGPRQLVGKGTAMTEAQSKSAMFGAAMNQANGIISKVEKDGTTTAPVAVSVLQGLAKLSPQFLGSGENAANAIESIFRQDPTSLLGPDVNQQKLGQAQIAFATAYLRATSGAAFGPSEVSNTIKEYFPLVGEDKTVVQQKAKARQRAIEGMKISTSKQGQSYIDKSGANANDPLELFGGKP